MEADDSLWRPLKWTSRKEKKKLLIIIHMNILNVDFLLHVLEPAVTNREKQNMFVNVFFFLTLTFSEYLSNFILKLKLFKGLSFIWYLQHFICIRLQRFISHECNGQTVEYLISCCYGYLPINKPAICFRTGFKHWNDLLLPCYMTSTPAQQATQGSADFLTSLWISWACTSCPLCTERL